MPRFFAIGLREARPARVISHIVGIPGEESSMPVSGADPERVAVILGRIDRRSCGIGRLSSLVDEVLPCAGKLGGAIANGVRTAILGACRSAVDAEQRLDRAYSGVATGCEVERSTELAHGGSVAAQPEVAPPLVLEADEGVAREFVEPAGVERQVALELEHCGSAPAHGLAAPEAEIRFRAHLLDLAAIEGRPGGSPRGAHDFDGGVGNAVDDQGLGRGNGTTCTGREGQVANDHSSAISVVDVDSSAASRCMAR